MHESLLAIVKNSGCGEKLFYQHHLGMLKLDWPSVSVSGVEVNGYVRLDRWVSISFYRVT